MGRETKIEYCDSTINPVPGCSGCELWHPKAGIRRCYAGNLVGRYAGLPGWPSRFERPQFFEGRVEQACRWSNLSGQKRPDKPWLNGRRRVIFLNDLGDSFSPRAPLYWLSDHLSLMAESPHVWLLLTKWPQRMAQFFEYVGWIPANFILGTSITGPGNRWRAKALAKIRHAYRWLSLEPLIEPFEPHQCNWLIDAFGLVVIGGESGRQATPLHMPSVELLIERARQIGAAVFFKQHGEWLHESQRDQAIVRRLAVRNIPVFDWPDGTRSYRIGKVVAGRTLGSEGLVELPKWL